MGKENLAPAVKVDADIVEEKKRLASTSPKLSYK